MQSVRTMRGTQQSNHLLHTPDAFMRTRFPGMKDACAIVHISPAFGAAFTQYTVELESGGEIGIALGQRFLYVTDGSVLVHTEGKEHHLAPRGYVLFPQGTSHRISSEEKSRAIVIEKACIPNSLAGVAVVIVGSEDNILSTSLGGDPGLQMKCLLPANPALDFAVNTMTYHPGAALKRVQIQEMEHGLAVLEGGGIYRLSEAWYRVTAGDFVWAGPWCPQWFGAIGKVPAKHLVFKNYSRNPMAGIQR